MAPTHFTSIIALAPSTLIIKMTAKAITLRGGVNHTTTVLNQYDLLDNTVETIVHTVLIMIYILCLYKTGVAQL